MSSVKSVYSTTPDITPEQRERIRALVAGFDDEAEMLSMILGEEHEDEGAGDSSA